MIRKTRLFTLLILMLVIGSLMNVGAADDKKITIGLVHITTTHPYHVGEIAGAREAARREGVEIKVRTGEGDLTKQISATENLLAEGGLDAITILPIDQEAFKLIYKKIVEQGIPLIVLQSYNKPEEATSMVGIDEINNGSLMGEMAIKLLTEKYGKPKGEIAIIGGMLGQDANTFRIQGFENVIKQYKDVKIVAITPSNWDPKVAMEITENYLTAYPNLDIIYSLSDGISVPAANIVQRAGKSDQIHILSIDGERLDAVKDGRITATTFMVPQYAGFDHQMIAIKAARGEKVPEIRRLKYYLVTKENVDAFIKVKEDITNNLQNFPLHKEFSDILREDYNIIID